jgi:phenylalanyl-tRNA synthetase beta chain
MKLSEQWLREWANPALSREEWRTKLTMAGLEVESFEPVAQAFSQVVIGEVIHVEKHPEADRLKVCQVNVGQPELLTIVCGAANVSAGMKVAAALVGAVLPNMKITRSKLRGVVSNGMLCSDAELSLAEESNGIMALPQDAPVGLEVWEYLNLSDYVMDINITPNRGDCLSVLGMAIETAAITGCPLTRPSLTVIKPVIKDTLPIRIEAPAACPRYVGRVVRDVKTDAVTPIWLQERLRRSGIRSISPIVDVMNYVMMELGQPMHAFDLQKITGGICVRMGSPAEEIMTLDGQTIQLDHDILTIADDNGPIAMAGVMGGLDSGVTSNTTDIFLESAFFTVNTIAQAVRRYKLTSESSYRFERGIDSTLQVWAIERATELLLSLTGGKPGPVIDIVHEEYLPKQRTISLRSARAAQLLGIKIGEDEIEAILQRLGCSLNKNAEGWLVTVPLRRTDMTLEVDLIEEIIRLHGYDRLPSQPAYAALRMNPCLETKLDLIILRRTLCDLGYHEVITYSFIDKKLQHLFDPHNPPKELINPIASDMNVMRTTLWPGLVNTLLYNQNRQQQRVRLFETGLQFNSQEGALNQQRVISGLVSGPAFAEQWGLPARPSDFFDVKGDLQNIFKLTKDEQSFTFQSCSHPALHPGQSTAIYRGDQYIGVMGALHPEIIHRLDISQKVVVFEILFDMLEKVCMPCYTEISKCPEIRRDLAIFVDQTVPVQQIQDTIIEVGGDLLRNVTVFDVYQGKEVAPHRKSIALALTLQHASRTLIDEEVVDVFGRIVEVLKQKFAAELRG